MILIISKKKEKSTSQSIQWLNYWNITFCRLNDRVNTIKTIRIANKGLMLKLEINKEIDFSSITSVWFRRGYLYFKTPFHPSKLQNVKGKKEVNRHLKDEMKTLKDYIYTQLKTKPSLNHPNVYNMNKLIALQKAKAVGFKIPDTIITQKKSEIEALLEEHGQIITKNIQDVMSIDMGNYNSGHTTKMVNKKELSGADNTFFYSLFQKAIDKKYELRIFYLNGKCYTTAIFSQRDEQTTVDYRNYNEDKMNRVIPYTLPKDVKEKVQAFMTSAELESGSLDIIVDKNGDYVFLEVNPVGQYDYVGKNCNYNLDKKIAEFLANPYQT